jgi:N-terminal region of Chorein or VPS13
MSRGLIEPTFKKYFSNYDEKKLEFSLLKGDLKVNNLFFNRDAINEALDAATIPFQLKFGMISKLNIKISILGLYIEKVEVEDLILVLSPDPTKTQKISERALDTHLKEAVLLHMLENHKALSQQAQLKSFTQIPGITKEIIDNMTKRKTEGETPFFEKGPILTTTDSNNLTVQQPKANLMGPEFFEIITGRLKFDINVKNVRIYYEDGQTLNQASGSNQKNFFSFCFNISELKLNTVRYCNLRKTY